MLALLLEIREEEFDSRHAYCVELDAIIAKAQGVSDDG